jgi:D-alanine-D-alanine ligase
MDKKINLLLLHNAATVKEENGIKAFYPFPQDIEIAKAVKRLDFSVSSAYFESDTWKDSAKNSDVIFNLCDAYETPEEEYRLIQELEAMKVPFTGCSSKTSKLCQDKFHTKNVLKKNGIRFPHGELITDPNENFNNFNYPLILKPLGEDGSNGIDEDSVVFNENQLKKKLSELFVEFKQGILAEEYVDGREFNVPLIGNENPEAMPPLEIDYSEDFEEKPKILTYKAKWSKNSNDFKNTYSKVATLSDDEKLRLTKTAIAAYKAAECTGYGSVDMRMDKEGKLYVIEVNPNCYIAPEADIVKAAASIEIGYEELLDKIIIYALQRFNKQELLSKTSLKI